MKRSKDYQKQLIIALKDGNEAIEYLNAALEAGDPEIFLLAIRNVAEAHGGMRKLAQRSKLNRENLYRILSKNGNPEIYSLQAILDALGLTLSVGMKGKKAA